MALTEMLAECHVNEVKDSEAACYRRISHEDEFPKCVSFSCYILQVTAAAAGSWRLAAFAFYQGRGAVLISLLAAEVVQNSVQTSCQTKRC